MCNLIKKKKEKRSTWNQHLTFTMHCTLTALSVFSVSILVLVVRKLKQLSVILVPVGIKQKYEPRKACHSREEIDKSVNGTCNQMLLVIEFWEMLKRVNLETVVCSLAFCFVLCQYRNFDCRQTLFLQLLRTELGLCACRVSSLHWATLSQKSITFVCEPLLQPLFSSFI